MTSDVEEGFRNIVENRKPPKIELSVDEYYGFLYFDKDGSIMYSLHWEHYLKHILNKYNGIYRVQLPKIPAEHVICIAGIFCLSWDDITCATNPARQTVK